MKIGQITDVAAIAATGASAHRTPADEASAAARPAAPAADASRGTTVQLSSAAADLMNPTPEFNAAKVESLRQAIADGSYKVNAEAIADKLLSNAREVLDRPAH